LGGPQIDGLVGSGSFLAVSTWKFSNDGTDFTNERLDIITPTRLRTVAGGPSAVMSVAADGGHIVVVPLPTMSMDPGYCVVATPSNSVLIRSAQGKLLRQMAIGAGTGRGEIALSGKRLLVAIGSPAPALAVYDWATGTLLHTWPVLGAASVPGPHHEGHVQIYGRLVLYSVYTQYVGGSEKLHLLDVNTGKDVVITIVKGFGDNREWAIGPRGLVYVVNSGRPPRGRLVFVPMAKLLAMLS
jgi:hypothetical protein